MASLEAEPARAPTPLLEVSDLTVRYRLPGGAEAAAVKGATFRIAAGEAVGLLGESGSGKTTLALSITGLLAPGARVAAGTIQFKGRDVLHLQNGEMRRLRGREISVVFQDPVLALSPVRRIGEQIADVIRAHESVSRAECLSRVDGLLDAVQLAPAERFRPAYPHELSGGELQRVLIAQAISNRPALLILDEPTASLDATTQAEILGLLGGLRRKFAPALLFISHDPAVLAALAERLLVMYAGRIVEEGPCARVLGAPAHPFTKALIASARANPAADGKPARLAAIPGNPADLADSFPGCPFEPRCPERMEICTTREPGETVVSPAHRTRCFKYGG